MIPITKTKKLEKEYSGVTYIFHPPVGEFEDAIINFSNQGEEDRKLFNKTKALYPMATEQLEKEYKGKRKPKKDEFTKLIEKRVMKLVLENVEDDEENTVQKNRDFIDVILFDWKSENTEVPKFPKNGKPSELLPAPLVAFLIKWYMGEYTLTEDELKK